VVVVAPSVLYRPSFEGIAPIALVSAAGTFQPEYRPGQRRTEHRREERQVFANRQVRIQREVARQ